MEFFPYMYVCVCTTLFHSSTLSVNAQGEAHMLYAISIMHTYNANNDNNNNNKIINMRSESYMYVVCVSFNVLARRHTQM